MMGGGHGMFKDFYGQNPDGTNDFWRYNVERFQAVDAFIDALRQADILAAPYLYYFNDGVQRGLSYEQDQAYVRYSMARMGAYANVMPVLSNEVEQKYNDRRAQGYDLRSHEWANQIGPYMKERSGLRPAGDGARPAGDAERGAPQLLHPALRLAVPMGEPHAAPGAALRAERDARDLATTFPEQRWPIIYSTRGYARHNQLMIDLRRFGIPVVNEEPGYEMKGHDAVATKIDPRPFNTQTTERLIPTFWTATCAGGYCMWGHMGTYVTDDPLPPAMDSETPRMLRALHDRWQRSRIGRWSRTTTWWQRTPRRSTAWHTARTSASPSRVRSTCSTRSTGVRWRSTSNQVRVTSRPRWTHSQARRPLSTQQTAEPRACL